MPATTPLRPSHPFFRNLPAMTTPTPLSTAQALQIIQTAFDTARSAGFKPMGVVVVDASSQVVASAREAGASALRLDIAQGKASAAMGMGVNSRTLAVRSKDVPVFFSAVASVARDAFIPQTGAVLITTESGQVIGAAGASGGTGDEDEQIVIAGIKAAGLNHA